MHLLPVPPDGQASAPPTMPKSYAMPFPSATLCSGRPRSSDSIAVMSANLGPTFAPVISSTFAVHSAATTASTSVVARVASVTLVSDHESASGTSSMAGSAAKTSGCSKTERRTKAIQAKAKVKSTTSGRLRWTNEMVSELLRLRFVDGEVKRRLEGADTKTKKALAWQLFASVLSQSLGMVIKQDQVSQKYRKLKCIYRKEKREANATGNNTTNVREIDEGLWAILNDAFASRVGLSGEVLKDTHLDEDDTDAGVSEEQEPSTKPNAKGPPVVQLASALQTGMEAVAASMANRAEANNPL